MKIDIMKIIITVFVLILILILIYVLDFWTSDDCVSDNENNKEGFSCSNCNKYKINFKKIKKQLKDNENKINELGKINAYLYEKNNCDDNGVCPIKEQPKYIIEKEVDIKSLNSMDNETIMSEENTLEDI